MTSTKTSFNLFCATAAPLFGLLALGLAAETQAGMISRLYVSSGNGIHVLQGSSILNSWSAPGGSENPIAVNTTVRTMGSVSFAATGREYTLSGTQTGTTYTHTFGGAQFNDGTTDGTYIYAVDFNTGIVRRFDSNWANPVSLFDAGGVSEFLGITYDTSNNSLWLSGWNNNFVRNFSMTGSLLSSFSTGHTQNAALALDPADGTLWLRNRTVANRFEQYSKTGTLLNIQDYPGLLGASTLGAEFAVPEPASLSLTLVGLTVLGLATLRKKHRRA